jgi:hypothetical protein
LYGSFTNPPGNCGVEMFSLRPDAVIYACLLARTELVRCHLAPVSTIYLARDKFLADETLALGVC